jgi:hypothetical protein
MLFLIFTAQIARTARRLDNPLYENELNVFNFLQRPDVLIGQALTLRYKPVNLEDGLWNVADIWDLASTASDPNRPSPCSRGPFYALPHVRNVSSVDYCH